MDIKLYIDGSDYILNYDIVAINDLIEKDFFIKQQQFTGNDKLINGQNKVSINFNHPVEKISIFTTKPVSTVILMIDNQYRLHFIKKNDLLWEFNFGKHTLNFSSIDYASILCNNEHDNNFIYVFSITHHVVRMMGGMFGLSFTK